MYIVQMILYFQLCNNSRTIVSQAQLILRNSVASQVLQVLKATRHHQHYRYAYHYHCAHHRRRSQQSSLRRGNLIAERPFAD